MTYKESNSNKKWPRHLCNRATSSRTNLHHLGLLAMSSASKIWMKYSSRKKRRRNTILCMNQTLLWKRINGSANVARSSTQFRTGLILRAETAKFVKPLIKPSWIGSPGRRFQNRCLTFPTKLSNQSKEILWKSVNHTSKGLTSKVIKYVISVSKGYLWDSKNVLIATSEVLLRKAFKMPPSTSEKCQRISVTSVQLKSIEKDRNFAQSVSQNAIYACYQFKRKDKHAIFA